MKHRITAALSVILLIVPAIAAETNSMVGVWRTGLVMSQLGPSETTYAFSTNGGFQMGFKAAQGALVFPNTTGAYWTTTNQLFTVSKGLTNIAAYSFQEGKLVVDEGGDKVFRLSRDLSQVVPLFTNVASAFIVEEGKPAANGSTTNVSRLAMQALAAGDTKAATRYATVWLNNTTNKQLYYYGSHIHDANQVLGLAALKENRMTDAKNYLLKAGAAPASPQLTSFGPRMELAQQLLEMNEKDVVIEYLDLVAKFWTHALDEMPAILKVSAKSNEQKIELWKKEIQQGKKPKLNRSEPQNREW